MKNIFNYLPDHENFGKKVEEKNKNLNENNSLNGYSSIILEFRKTGIPLNYFLILKIIKMTI